MDKYTNDGMENSLHLSRTVDIKRKPEAPAQNWDELKKELDEETTVYKVAEFSENQMGTASKVVTNVTGFLAYVVLGLVAAACVWLVLQDLSMYRKCFPVVIAAYLLSGIVLTLDAILINRGYKPNKSLYVFAWVLNFLYPFRRDGHLMKKSNILHYILTVVIILGFAGVGCQGFRSHCIYKAVHQVNGKEDEEKVAALMSQDADGTALAEQLYQSFHVNGVAVHENGKVTKIVLLGTGNFVVDPKLEGAKDVKWSIKENLFVGQGSFDTSTQLVFIKGMQNTEYRLSTVKINDELLPPSYIYNYWKKVVLRWDENAEKIN